MRCIELLNISPFEIEKKVYSTLPTETTWNPAWTFPFVWLAPSSGGEGGPVCKEGGVCSPPSHVGPTLAGFCPPLAHEQSNPTPWLIRVLSPSKGWESADTGLGLLRLSAVLRVFFPPKDDSSWLDPAQHIFPPAVSPRPPLSVQPTGWEPSP